MSVERCNFITYAEKWLKLNSSGKSQATIKEYNYILYKYLIPTFKNYPLDSIKRMDIQNLQSELINNNHYELAHKCVRFMKTILNDALCNGYINKNVCIGIKEPKLVHKEKQVLSAEQDQILLESKHKHAPFFRILRYTGMRREEIAGLKIDDIDLNNKTITIQRAVSYASNQAVIKETKNKKSRTIPLLDVIYDDIKKRIDYCNENNIKYLYTKQSDINCLLSQESIRCMTSSFCKDSGFTFTPHQLRHSYCTMLYYSGITIKETQKLMGHSSADMVYNIYAHLDEEKENSSSKINSYLNVKCVK